MGKPYIFSDVVIKHHGANLDRDWARVNTLFAASLECKGIEAAEPLGKDEEKKTITYRRITDLIPYLGHARRNQHLASLSGRLLSQLHHTDIDTTPATKETARNWLGTLGLHPDDVEIIHSTSSPGFVLTDCWHGNLFWKPDNTLVVLDPLPVLPCLVASPLRAYGVIDAAMLHMSHFFYHGVLASTLTSPSVHYAKAADAMLLSYATHADYDASLIHRISGQLAKLYINFYKERLPPALAGIKSKVARRAWRSIYGDTKDE